MESHDAEFRESGQGWASKPKPERAVQPLTDEQLTSMRLRHDRSRRSDEWRTTEQHDAIADRGQLLAEVDRLNAVLADGHYDSACIAVEERDRLRAALARITSFCRCQGTDCAATIARAALAAAVSPEGSPQ